METLLFVVEDIALLLIAVALYSLGNAMREHSQAMVDAVNDVCDDDDIH